MNFIVGILFSFASLFAAQEVPAPRDRPGTPVTQAQVDSIYAAHIIWYFEIVGHENRNIGRYNYHFRNLRRAIPDDSMYRLYTDTRNCARGRGGAYDEFFVDTPFFMILWWLFDEGWFLDNQKWTGYGIAGVMMVGNNIMLKRSDLYVADTVVHEILHVFFPLLWHSPEYFVALKQCIEEVW